jgi:hypothetical protein
MAFRSEYLPLDARELELDMSTCRNLELNLANAIILAHKKTTINYSPDIQSIISQGKKGN